MTKQDVLNLLRNQTAPLSGQKIAEELKISRTAVWKAVEALRRDGYEISSRPHLGYSLINPTKKLTLDEIQSHLPGHPWRDNLIVLECVDSTNNFAKQLAAAGAPEGTAVIAECQTNGRGRRGRTFTSPAEQGIYLSVILRPKGKPTDFLYLTAAVAEAIAEALEAQTGLQIGIKWVNDLVVNGRKLAGILTEVSLELESGLVDYIVVGIGINCCQEQNAFPPEIAELATSIAAQSGKCPDRNALAAAMLQALYQLSKTLRSEQWMQLYAAHCITIGKQVQILRADGIREAVALGIDENAALEVAYPDGTRAWISSGEVSVRGLYGYV